MIEFNNFSREYSFLKDEIDLAVNRVLSSGRYVLGKEVSNFENNFSDYIGAKYCVSVASGTDALTISLMALGIESGDEVITTSMTAYPTIIGILNAGAKPVLVDINPDDMLISPVAIEAAINKKTKAVIPVHLYGQCCNMERIAKIASKFNIHVVEDCAQSTGSSYKNKNAGTIGTCGAFSFYPTKNLGCYGDGGAIVTDQDDIYVKLKLLRNYGQEQNYNHNINGLNSRLDEIQAAILSAKLPHLDAWNKRRNEIAQKYLESLQGLKFLTKSSHVTHSYHLFVARISERERFAQYLEKNGVQSLIHYPIPAHEQAAFEGCIFDKCKHASSASKEIISLPINPWLKNKETDFIIECINNFK